MLIGREKEKDILNSCYNSDKSEFVALYGRRRIGKTFLIKELFESKFLFYSTGILNGSKDAQLEVWNNDMSRFGGADLNPAVNWIQAFGNLNLLLERSSAGKKVIFLDEIPWMATMHSDFLAGLDYFWNRFASSRRDVMLIICGSAASWIVDKVINDTGGLHNRLTRQISLKPFNLNECEQYFESRKVPMTRYQIAEAYMIFGGIPYYLSLMDPRYSLYQNVDKMYFESDAELSWF
jgi:AAA+ ATPase superfamily predicted ATPase